jgi:GT2 family glycosyltransferase
VKLQKSVSRPTLISFISSSSPISRSVMQTIAIVVAWNSRADLLNCLTALARSGTPVARIIVVDNASTDGTAAAVRAAFPNVELLQNARNEHFARGANAGLRRALDLGAEWAWVLNPDATPAPGALGEMLRVAQTDERIGMVGARLAHPARPGYAARVIVGANCDFATGGIVEPAPPMDLALDRLAVDYVWGASLLARAAVLREVGLFDESYRAYFEDADLCLRAKAAGWRTVTALRAEVAHIGSSVGDQRFTEQMWLRARNHLRCFWRHAPHRQRASLLLWMLARRWPEMGVAVIWRGLRGA